MDRQPPVGPPARRFTLADAALLIAALAIGAAMVREPIRQMNLSFINNAQFGWWFNNRWWAYVAAPLLAPTTVAVVVLGLRRPRPPRAELFRGPGIVACTAASVALALRGVAEFPRYLTGQGWMAGPIMPWVGSAAYVGYAVLAAWAILVLSGDWRSRSGWIDRLGVALGACWALAPFEAIHNDLYYRGGDLVRRAQGPTRPLMLAVAARWGRRGLPRLSE